jgi:hypothetical protein
MKRYAAISGVIAGGALLACSSGGGGTGSRDDGGSSGSSSGGSGSSSGMSSSSSGSSGSSGGQTSSGVSLAVNSASSPSTVGGVAATGNSFLVVVDLTLKNSGASVPLSTNFVLFSLQTNQALVVSASPQQPPGQCSPTVSVATGGQIECQVAFDVPAGQTPTTLLYDDQRGDRASAPVPAIPVSTACETFQRWTSGASLPCAMCIQQAVVSSCVSENDAYNNSCGGDSGACSACASVSNICSCERSCDSASCQSLFATVMSCVVSTCGSTCP